MRGGEGVGAGVVEGCLCFAMGVHLDCRLVDGVGRLAMYWGVEGREIWICVGERGRKGKGKG